MPSGGPAQMACSTEWRSWPRWEGVSPAWANCQPCAARRAVAKALKGHCDCEVRTLEPPSASPGGKGMRLESSKRIVSGSRPGRSEEHTSELQSLRHLV